MPGNFRCYECGGWVGPGGCDCEEEATEEEEEEKGTYFPWPFDGIAVGAILREPRGACRAYQVTEVCELGFWAEEVPRE